MVISLAGEWDIYRRDELQERLLPAESEERAILDLTLAKYVTSTLICALILTHKVRETRRLPHLRLCVTSAFVRRLLGATGLEGMFPIHDSVAAAIDADSGALKA